MFYPVQSTVYVWKLSVLTLKTMVASAFGRIALGMIGVVFVLSLYVFPPMWVFLALLFVFLSLIDVVDHIVPDICLVCLGIVLWSAIPVLSCASALMLGVTLSLIRLAVERWRGLSILGWGDIKLMTLLLCFLPLESFPIYFFVSGVLGVVSSFASRGAKRVPFVPALSAAWVLTFFVK